ncbi:tyrocidine synthetase 1 [Metarhizium guizhouense ARSEF 977]|uniref:Tyrocidine synthetase 1 n=1 Tax=Metarhizium guizhouense (strain ARSEF 977) TaxID=1276136 RepID=A0A0B4H5E5_METGA|nr:tyrocidine synthetase 1 [Metarhizium guizhouense ARSEF 977]
MSAGAISYHLLLNEILEEQAQRSPENVTLEFHLDVNITYNKLNNEVNRLARHLDKYKSQSGEVVVVCCEKSPLLVVAIIAILKAGMAWVPIPMDAPPARISSILRACDARFALCCRSARQIVQDLASLIVLDDLVNDADFLAYPTTNIACQRKPSDLCHVLFTSGSTGVPKGVALEHRAMVHCIYAMVKEFGLTAKTRTLQFSAATFDAFSLDVFMSIACGGCLVMAPPSTMLADMTAFVRNARITYAHLTPTVLDMIDPLGVPDFQTVSSTGEALSENLANRWRRRVRLFNSYGPTETIVCTIQYHGDDQIDAACIGKAVEGLQVCLLAPGELDEVARGEVGEICVAGPHLFRGYISAEKLPETALKRSECFRNGIRCYRTGDMGKIEACPGGGYTLRYLGRRDGQVKIHGIRTDLGDVEQSILACEAVNNCVAILPRSGPSQGRLCCIVTLRLSPTAEPNAESRKAQFMGDSVELLNCCNNVLSALKRVQDVATARLPTHALPTSWWAVKEFPRTSSGKIDRVKLRSIVEGMDKEVYIRHVNDFACKVQIQSSPSNIVEQQLQSLWADVLDRPISDIDTSVSFIQFGADSLDVIRLISKARTRGIQLDIPQIYATRTIRQLARVQQPLLEPQAMVQNPVYRPFSAIPADQPLGQVMKNAATTCQVRVEEIEDIFATTPYQAGLMTSDLKSPGTYICAFSWTLLKNIDIERFRSNWKALLADEAVLRSRLIWDETRDGFWQVIIRHGEMNWSEEYFEAPMSLGTDLCRGYLKWHDEIQGWKFSLKIHHSIIDGWSLRLMLNRLRSMYFGQDVESPQRLSFAEFMHYRMDEENRKQSACATFWSNCLEGSTQLDFPPWPSESYHEVHATEHQSIQITGSFQQTGASFGVTQATLLYAAVALLLGMNADSQDVTFGLILAGRESPLDGVFDMIGPAFASFPLRTKVDRRMTMKSFLQRIQDDITNIIPYQHYGLQRIRQCGEGAARACDLRCLVIVQPEDENLGGQGLWDEVHGQTSGRADSIPVTLEFVLDDGKILVNCNFDPAFLSRQDAGILLGQLGHVLKNLEGSTSGTDLLVSQVKLEGQDAHSAFVDWAERHGAPVEACLHELFHDNVEQHADRMAIDDQGTRQQITYQKLDAYSSRLCSHLELHHEIGPETMIPVVLTKSPLAVITILAVLKAGGAYVPIDPNWPMGRVRHILQETRASVLLLCAPDVSRKYSEGTGTTALMDLTDYSWEKKQPRAEEDKRRIVKAAASTNLACVLYTSGSTGLPKGVMLEHGALCTSLTHLTRVFDMKPGTRHLQFSSFVFDLSVADMFIPLFSGGCICIPTEENRLNRLSLTMGDMAIESAILTPSLADLIAPEGAASLHTLMTAESGRKEIRLLNAYGLIETSIVTSVSDPISPDTSPTNIGRSVTAWHWIVRQDSTGALYSVPKGYMGEIAVAGQVLARGYVNNSSLTAKHFVEAPDLAVGLTPSRIYLTGDIGRCTADGSICLVGRKDQMVKVNGIRVEPAESEQQPQQQGGMFASCVVQWLRDEQSNAKLAAFVQVGSPDSGEQAGSNMIAVEESSASCAIYPHAICTDSMDAIHNIWQGGFEATQGPSAKSPTHVSSLWREPRREAVYRHPRLGDLAAVASPVQKGIKPLRAFSMVDEMNFHDKISIAADKCGVKKTQVVDVYPCTAMQEALMISSAKSSGGFFNQDVFRLADETLSATLETALQSVWAKHAILRTRIILDNEYRSFQVVVEEELEIALVTKQTVQEYLRRDAALVPGYGGKLCRCAILKCTAGTYLVISQHHAIYDALSTNLVLSDIEQQYSVTNVSRDAPPPFSSLVQYVTELRKAPQAQNYWKQNLKGVSVTALPHIKTPTDFEANQKYSMQVQLPVDDRHSLATIAEAAWGLLLCRYTGLEDVSFGCVRTGRTAPVEYIDSIVGPTIVTVPRRVFAPRRQVVGSYLESIEAAIIDTLPWEQFGHQNIRKLGSDAHNACQFSSLLVVQLLPPESETATSKILIPQTIGDSVFKEDCLTVECQPRGNHLIISIMYDDRAISREEVGWIAYNFSRLLSALVVKPRQTLDELDIIGLRGTKQVQMWNSSAPAPSPTRVDQLFSLRAREWPSLNAVSASDALLTYAELDELSSKLAARLGSLGIARGNTIPLLTSKSAVAIVSMLAILKAGAAYVPLALDSAKHQLELLRGKLDVEMVLCTPDQASKLLNQPVKVVCCTIEDFMLEEYSAFPLIQNGPKPGRALEMPQAAVQSDVAYTIFTSQDDVEPKGLLFNNTALSIAILSMSQRVGYPKATRTLSFFPYASYISVPEIWLTLLHGGCLFLPNEEQQTEDLCGYMNENKIELAFLTSTVAKNLFLTPSKVPTLKTLYTVGEPFSHTLLERWSPKVRLVHLYGSAESCAYATIKEHVTTVTDPNNIGDPFASRAWVVDPEDYSRLAPVGCRGELLLSGPTLACGYLNDDEVANPAFINGSTFSWALPGESRFYATGDIVRQNSDGSINYIAKNGHYLKLNGLLIALEQTEYEIEQCEGVVSAMVEKFGQSENSTEFLVAFFTLATTTKTGEQCKLLDTTDDVQHMIQTAFTRVFERFPPNMVPRFYLPICTIPLTTSGLVDRGALRRIVKECSHDKMALYRPGKLQKRETQTSIEKVLQGLWAQTWSLDPSQIDLDSQFLSLGGDSLTAIRLATMCREVGFKLEVADILRNTKFEHLARLVEQRQDSAPNSLPSHKERNGKSSTTDDVFNQMSTQRTQAARICQIDVSQIEDVYPCTPTMEALIAATARIPNAYIARESFQIPPSVDLQRFRSAWDLVSRNNPIMRTRICCILTDGGFKNVQVVCKLPHDWNESATDGAFNASMTMGSSLFRYRIRNSHQGPVFEVLKHHAVFDGYSSTMLWEDFQYAYEYSHRPPPRPPFKNYIGHIHAQDEEGAARFWKRSTGDFHGEHFPALPSSQYTPATASSHRIERCLKWTDSCPFTFANVVRAAWAILVSMRSRSSGQIKKACFAVTTSGRGTDVAGIDKMAGPTITTVPVLVELNMDQSIAEYLSQIHEQAMSMMPYEYYGLGRIQKVSESAREACRIRNLLVVQPAHLEDDVLPLGLTRVLDDQSGMVGSFGLVTECSQNRLKHTISLSALYDPMLMQRQEVNGMLEQLSWMIASLNRNSTALSTIQSTIWSLAEQHDFSQFLAWNKTPQCCTKTCLHELVEISAACKPHDLAVDAHDGKLTYAELDTAAVAVKETLVRRHGIGPGDLVPLCFEKSASMIVAMMGVFKAGAGYVPLDTSHPSSRLEFIIQEVKAKVVIVSTLQHNALRFSVQTLALASTFPFIAPTWTQTPHEARLATPSDVAYVIFTSGSTGQPKGVVMEHGAASLSILGHGKRYQHDRRGNKTRALQFSSYMFDASVLDIFAVLAYGGCVCIPSEQDRIGHLEEVFIKMKINFVDLTPTVANLLEPAALPGLTGLTLAGEMASRALIDKWACREPPLEVFVNSYGPTEVAISCAVGPISPERPVGHVGKSLGGYLWIVDQEDCQHLMPIGCVGELVVSGPTLARGYLNDAEKTNAAFIRHVDWIAKEKDNILYKTGDLARFDFDGNVEMVGRKDDGQIKLNGLSIELGEIENAIESCPRFSGARHVAVAKVNMSGNNTLAAFLELPDCQATSPDSLLAHPSDMFKQAISKAAHRLQNHLPQYMIPKLWIPVCSWPLNAAGKTDRRRLVSAAEAQTPAKMMEYLQTTKADCSSDEMEMKTRAEEILEDAWKQVLNRQDGVTFELHDDFFAVGGDSLTTIRLISLLKAKGVQVTAQDIFGAKTLRNMASIIYSKSPGYIWARDGSMSRDQNMNGVTGAANKAEMPPALAMEIGIEDVYPASHIQLSFLVECQKWWRAYCCWFFIDVGTSPIPQVQQACATVALRHPILRTSFHLVGQECHQAVQKIAPNFKVLFSRFSPADWCEQLDKDVARPVCFGEVLTRFRLLMDAETGRRVLALGLSHAQYDGFCTSTILNDLGWAYAGGCWENPSPPKYRDFIRHTIQQCNNEADCFWREKLEGSTLTSIVRPFRGNARPVMSRGSRRTIAFAFKHSAAISYPVMLKVAWAITLSQISQSCDVTFGNLVSGRYAAFQGAQEVVGPCLNVIPFRVRIDTNQCFGSLLKDAYHQGIDTIPFEATPFNRIAAQSPWPGATGFHSMFQYQNIPGREDEDQVLPGSGWKKLGSAVYGGGLLQSGACWLTAWPSVGGTARFLLRYSEETMETSDAEAVMDLFVGILRLINNDPEASVSSVSRLYPPAKTIQSHCLVPLQPDQPSSSSQSRPPATALTPIMDEFTSIWKCVLGFDGEIHPHDSFFDMAGDSIAAARMASVCAKMGLGLSVQDIIDCPTLMSQVDFVTGRAQSARKPREEVKLVYEDSYEFI